MTQADKQERHDRQLAKAYDAAGREQFAHPADVLDGATERALVAQFSEMLAPVFAFIAKGRLTGTMGMRSWAVLYCTSVNHVGGETIAEAAARFDVSPPRLYALVKEFKAVVPTMGVAFEKGADQRARMSDAHRRHPPMG